MPRYFFDLQNHTNTPDESGTVLGDANAARIEAVILAGAYLRDHPDLIWDGQTIRVIVRTEDRTILFMVLTQSVDLS